MLIEGANVTKVIRHNYKEKNCQIPWHRYIEQCSGQIVSVIIIYHNDCVGGTSSILVVHCTEVGFASFLSGGFTYYYGSNKSTGKETGKTHFCALGAECLWWVIFGWKPKNFGWFSWEWSKKNFFFKMADWKLKTAYSQNFFCENFRDWSLGQKLKSSKTGKKVFRLFLSLCWTASRPYLLSYTNFLCINQSY